MNPYLKSLLVILLLTLCVNCDISDIESNKTQEEEFAELVAHKAYIVSLIENATCNSNDQCAYVGLGSKPCGGPWEYLVYPSTTDTKLILEQVAIYNFKENNYNKKWGIISDCMYVMPPIRVDCINNKCVAVYSN